MEQQITATHTSSEGSYSNLHNFIETARIFQDQDMDMVIPVTGEKGSGKSTFSLQATRVYLEKYFPHISFQKDIKRFVLFDNEEVYENLMNEDEYLPLDIDEALRFMMGEDHGKSDSKDMKKLFGQIRIRHRLVFANIPNFWWLDRKYREDMVEFWVHVIGRGKAILFVKDRKIGVADKWHRKEFEKMKGHINLFTPLDKIINMYRKHPCFLDVITFPKAEERLYEKYLEMRKESLLTQKITMKTGRVNAKEIIWAYELRKQDMSFGQISKIIKRPKGTIQSWIEMIGQVPFDPNHPEGPVASAESSPVAPSAA